MEIYAPDYYKSFSCIANECKHTCCAGWEIDIDDETLKKYKACKNSFAEQIMENIEETDEISHFILKEERCPFLNNDNLCDTYSPCHLPYHFNKTQKQSQVFF